MISLAAVSAAPAGSVLFSPISLTVNAGECCVLRGENGIGKTSLLELIAGLHPPACGKMTFHGQPITRPEDYLGYCHYIGHALGLRPYLTVAEYIDYYQALSDTRISISQVLHDIGLADKAAVPIGRLSAGQQKKVALSRLFISERSVWLLDEPFVSLDDSAVRQWGEHIQAHCAVGGVVVMSSHHALRDVPFAYQEVVLHAAGGAHAVS